MNGSASSHPADQTLQDYGVGKLRGNLADSVQAHLMVCAECRRRVAETSTDTFLRRVRNVGARPETSAPLESQSAEMSLTAEKSGSNAPSPTFSLPAGLSNLSDYEILRELGRGGMGVVYLARNKLLRRNEALKVVSRDLMDRHGVIDRFLREIRSAARLHHANIVTAYAAIRAGESLVFAMEYVEGYDLGQLVKGQGPLPVAHACNFIYQAALGLQCAHEQGMVHRDIKPSNLILARLHNKPVVKVLDFGLAKATREGSMDAALTHEGQMLGTPAYIAPEQSVDAQKADIRADIYSLGCTLYYVLSGAPPFQGSNLYEVLQAHHSMDAKPLNLVRPQVPRELAALVGKMMAKDPGRRFQTPGDLAQALKPFFRAESQGARPSTREVSLESGFEISQRIPDAGPSRKTEHRGEEHAPVRAQPQVGSRSGGKLEEPKLPGEPRPATKKIRPAGSLPRWPVATGVVVLLGLAVASATWIISNSKKGDLRRRTIPEPGKVLGVTANAATGARARDAMIVVRNLPSGAVVEIDAEEVAIGATIPGAPVTVRTKPGKHVVVVKHENDVLLAEGVVLEAGGQRTLYVPIKDRLQKPAPSLASSGPRPAVAHPSSPAAAQPSTSAAAQPSASPPTQPPQRLPKIEFVRIEGGEYTMGSPDDDLLVPDYEKPQRKVLIRPFFLGATEVTQEQYQAVMRINPSDFSATGAGQRQVDQPTGRFPVENVSWFDAISFCNSLSSLEGVAPYYQIETRRDEKGVEQSPQAWIPDPKGPGNRLPTEAEWEYACRAGTTTQYPFAEELAKLAQSAWFDDNSVNMPHPVGEKRPNDRGVFDMYGNVAEWCWDWYAPYDPDSVANPRGPNIGSTRVVRGGSWRIVADGCRPAVRSWSNPSARDRRLGFRVAKYGSGR